jgi:hypothetical protein
MVRFVKCSYWKNLAQLASSFLPLRPTNKASAIIINEKFTSEIAKAQNETPGGKCCQWIFLFLHFFHLLYFYCIEPIGMFGDFGIMFLCLTLAIFELYIRILVCRWN